MKSFLISFLLVFVALNVKCQSFENFIETEGAELIVKAAHPTHLADKISYIVTGDTVLIIADYYDKQCIITLFQTSGLVSKLVVESEYGFLFPAFATISAIKDGMDIAIKNLPQSDRNDIIRITEDFVKKKIDEFDGKDFTILLTNIKYLNYLVNSEQIEQNY
jgi:hypothetical protein